MGPSRQCKVCNDAQSKYKCPSCLIPYCSLLCFKKHKESPCKKQSPSEEKSEVPCENPLDEKSEFPCKNPSYEKPGGSNSFGCQMSPKDLPDISYQVEEQRCILQMPKYDSIVSSSEIRDALKDENLRRLVSEIDRSKNPESELEKAMEGRVFREFTEKYIFAAKLVASLNNPKTLTEEAVKSFRLD